ncbi:hypothetical protein UFOVP1142_6 [uncultured Caudovirales phage]|uniref:Uncharacterized protein n=1 Tax=uncultured Caudovirales phage TaxID=2100421 RepID=A0A6J5QMZ4_9CAUD|nr:hypothetical protein UFOVP1142_6 [uncultured Caudovirales phage]
MAIPTVNAFINFSSGASFGQTFIIGQGILGTNILADGSSVIVDVSDQLDTIQTTRGRNAAADQFQAGTLTMRIVDQNGDFNPQNTSSPYYGLLSPMRKVQITATYSGTTYPIFSGYITGYNTITPKYVGDVVYTTITAIDGMRLLSNALVTTIIGAVAGEDTGTRVGRILDQVGWPTSLRSIQTGDTTCQADPGSQRSALAAIQVCQTTEYGAFYIDPNGIATFKNRSYCTSSPNNTPTVFNDNGSNIPYYNAMWLLNDAQVVNQAAITATGLATQTAISSSSIAKYFVHSYTQNDLLMQDTSTALNYALAYVASRAETTIRCDAMTLDLYYPSYNSGIIAALDLDYFDPVSITTTQPAAAGTSSITKNLQVFGVQHSISVNSWKTTFTTLEPIIDGFIIGSSLYGVLGTNTLSY